MKPEVNAVLQEVKANLGKQELSERINALRLPDPQPTPTPTTPDFSKMTAVDATRWCLKNGITKAGAIAKLTGKNPTSVYTAMWKIKHPKRSKRLNRESKARREAKGASVAKVAKPTKTKKPKIENGYYADGMETPFLDALNRQRIRYDLFEKTIPTNNESELMAENRRLKILVDHYESWLFKGGK